MSRVERADWAEAVPQQKITVRGKPWTGAETKALEIARRLLSPEFKARLDRIAAVERTLGAR